jgi:arylsulfatase A
MATLADLSGGTLPKGKDSISYLPTLLGQPQTQTHDYVVVNNGFRRMGRSALITREGWKLVETGRKPDTYQLYNIKTDNEERHNLEDQYPERVAKLSAILRKQIGSARPDLSH